MMAIPLVDAPLRTSRLRLTFALGLLLVALETTVASAQAPASESFLAIGGYELDVDGARVASKFYHSPGLASVLVESPALDRLYEIDPKTRSVKVYAEVSFSRNPDGSRDKRSTAVVESSVPFDLASGLPSFDIGGHRIALAQHPPALGKQDHNSLIEHDPGYGARGRSFTPAATHLERIRAHQGEIVVRVFFGSWCSVCAELVPKILKLEESLTGTSVKFDYYGLPRGGFDDPEAKRLGVTSVPTGIVFVDGKEIGRVTGASLTYPDMALANALEGVGIPDVGRQP